MDGLLSGRLQVGQEEGFDDPTKSHKLVRRATCPSRRRPNPLTLRPGGGLSLRRHGFYFPVPQRKKSVKSKSKRKGGQRKPQRPRGVAPTKNARRFPRAKVSTSGRPSQVTNGVFRQKITKTDIASLYEAFPGAFEPVPRMQCKSERDSFMPRATVRVKYMFTDIVPAGILYYASPSPLAQLGASGTQWCGGYSCPTTSSTTYLVGDEDMFKAGITAGADKIKKDWYMTANNTPTIFGSADQPQSLCGGFACLTVSVPYNGTCNVYSVGPTDCSTQQGILTGDWWRKSFTSSAIVSSEPRRQCWRSADFHGNSDWQTIKTVLDPIPIIGSSESAQQFFGFAIVPDGQFTPNLSSPTPNNTFVASDFYPSGNAMSGPLQGQGSFYVENTGAVQLEIKMELYVDFCVSVGEESQRYISPTTIAMGPEGHVAHPVNGAQFPGLKALDCRDLLYKMMVLRLPPVARKGSVLKLAKTLVDSYMSQAKVVSSKSAKIVPSTLDHVEAVVKSVGTAVENGVEDVVTDIEHPIDTVEKVVSSAASVASSIIGFIEKEI